MAQPLVAMARLAGYDPILIDPRETFAAEARFPGEVVLQDWPDEALARLAPDSRTAIVTLTHDPKLDDPAIHVALRSGCFYLGCLGSKKTHARGWSGWLRRGSRRPRSRGYMRRSGWPSGRRIRPRLRCRSGAGDGGFAGGLGWSQLGTIFCFLYINVLWISLQRLLRNGCGLDARRAGACAGSHGPAQSTWACRASLAGGGFVVACGKSHILSVVHAFALQDAGCVFADAGAFGRGGFRLVEMQKIAAPATRCQRVEGQRQIWVLIQCQD